ncbi:MAG: glycoside hydrolase family 2 TIM barrel-domain containing protein [Candidatus Izemoplasmatales bacterium]
MRKNIPLNFDWLFAPVFEEGYPTAAALPEGMTSVSIPHTVKELPLNDFDERDYQFVSSYVRDFETPATDEGDRTFIRFGAVMTVAEVWMNGTFVGRHEGGFTPFAFDVTDLLKKDGTNRLFVKVDSREIKDVPPFGNVVDYLCYGGIYREVELQVRPKRHLERLFVRTSEAPSLALEDMILDVRGTLSEESAGALSAVVSIRRDAVEAFRFDIVPQIDGRTFDVQYECHGVERWNLESPVLYDIEVAVLLDGVEFDREVVRFGFRTAQFTHEGFVLNNRKIKLVGLNRHQSYPYVGYAMPKRIQAKDAEILKNELGVNLVRTSHYMQSDHFIDRCDELGLLVFEEIPGWQYIGDEHFKQLSCENLEAMIRAHANHPSIVLWGVRINESPDDHDFYEKTNEIAHALDDSRQTGGVRNFRGSELLEDVYTYNDFSHVGDNPGLIRPRKAAKAEVPYLVTEHNGHIFPTKKYDHEAKRVEHALRHMRVIDASFAREDACGAIGWCMNDYNTHVDFGSGDRICYHGVMDMFRLPKYAAAAYASQRQDRPMLVVASTMAMGDHALSRIPPTVVFTNCDYVKVYKNDTYIDTFYSAWKDYPNAPYAPVVVDDYYGDQIEKNEDYPKRTARMVKKVLVAFGRHGMDLPLSDKLRALWLMTVKGFTFAEAERLYGKYIGDWGKEGAKYVYEGYRDDKPVVAVTKGAHRSMVLSAVADDSVLVHGDTYDATRIVVRMTDERGNELPYAFDAFTVETTPGLAVIGPRVQSLLGGSVGVYVKTTGIRGQQTVTIRPEGRPALEVAIRID